MTIDTTSDAAIETEIQAKGLNAPRVTLEAIESRIVGEFYFTVGAALNHHSFINQAANPLDQSLYEDLRAKLDVFTVCVLQLDNGFVAIGESAPVSPANYDQGIGHKISRQKAFDKLWPVFGFALLERQRFESELKKATGEA